MVKRYNTWARRWGTGISVGSEKLVAAAALELLGNLKLALAQLRLYPKDSPQVTKTVTAAFQSLSAFLEQAPQLALAASPAGLLLNGQRLGAKDFATVSLESALIAGFLDAAVKSLVCRKGVQFDEFLTFLDAFVHKFWDLRDRKEINAKLLELGVRRISVDEIEYVAVGEGDILLKDAAQKLEQSGARVHEILRTLEQLTDAAVDPQVGADGRLEIMKKLLEQDPLLLEKAKAEPLARDRADRLPGLLPLEKGREGVGEVARLLQQAPPGLRPGLLKIGSILIESYRHDPRLMTLMKQFLAAEAEELLPDWLRGEVRAAASEGGSVGRAKTLLALAGDEQAEPLLQEAAALVRELLPAGRRDLAARIMARLTGLLLDRNTSRRRAAADALLSLHPSWDTEPLAAAREGFEGLIRSAFDVEPDLDTYGRLAEIATILADGRLRHGEPELALETLSLFRRHHTAKDGAPSQRSEVAFRAIERITKSPGFPDILHRLRTGDPVALRVVESLGDPVAPQLVEDMKRIELTTQRMPLAEAISRIGPSAAAILSAELQKATQPAEALRLLEVLPHAAPETIATAALATTLHHPVSAVRRRSAALLTDRAYARSGDLLLQAMKDEKDPTIRATIVEGLGKLRVSGAFELLAGIADSRSESDDLRSGACMALARLGHAEAIPILAGVAARASRGLGLLKAASPALRAAAVRALGMFPTQPAAREALKKLTEDSDPALQAVARETLFRPIPASAVAAPAAAREASPAAASHDGSSGKIKLAGSLQEVGLDQICQLVGGTSKTGLLMLSLQGRVGRIWFDQGQVVAADFERLQDQHAVNAMAREKKGDFIFKPGERPAQARVQLAVPAMLLEAFRVADEGRH